MPATPIPQTMSTFTVLGSSEDRVFLTMYPAELK